MAVLPTPGSPISTGLFLVRRASTWMVRRISSSRPMTGSSLPSRASSVTSRAYLFSASKLDSALGLSTLRPLRMSATAFSSACAVAPAVRSTRAAGLSEAASAISTRSCATYSSPALAAACWAASRMRTRAGVICGWPAPAPCTFGILPSSRASAVRAALSSPPAARIRPAAAPSSSSSSAFSRCSGVNCWWKSRMAMVCAAWRKPFARSVNFSMSMALSLSRRPNRAAPHEATAEFRHQINWAFTPFGSRAS